MGSAQVIGGLVVLAIGVFITSFASRLSYGSDVGPGPGFLPFWIGIGLGACGLAITLKAARLLQARRQDRFLLPKTRQVVFIFLTLVVAFLLLPVLGLSLCLALFTGFTMRVTGRHGWLWCGLATVVTAAAIRLVFGYLLDIPLPNGILGI